MTLMPHRFIASLMVAAALTVAPAARAVDYTDIWYDPAESGWGVNLVQGHDVLFATFFVYGQALQPTWYIAVLTNDGTGVFSGSLYVTSGSWLGAPWDPTQSGINGVGSATFRPIAADAGVLSYNVSATAVSKTIVRQTLRTIILGGGYLGGVVADQFSCSNPLANITVRRSGAISVDQSTTGGGQINFAFADGVRCSLRGNLVQRGQLYSIPGAIYTCSTGLNTTANVTELHATAQGIEGRWSAGVGGGCTEQGRFAGVLE
ncbi:MAG: hypothetical protein ABI920_02110 [Casimicrobiaceae bacterium]